MARKWLFGVIAVALCVSGASAQERAERSRADGHLTVSALSADGWDGESVEPVVLADRDKRLDRWYVTRSLRLVWAASLRLVWMRDETGYGLMVRLETGPDLVLLADCWEDVSLADRLEELTEHTW